jgi:hypothetical protein
MQGRQRIRHLVSSGSRGCRYIECLFLLSFEIHERGDRRASDNFIYSNNLNMSFVVSLVIHLVIGFACDQAPAPSVANYKLLGTS